MRLEEVPFERLENCVIDCYSILAELGNRVFLRVTDATILQRSENRCGNKFILHQLVLASKKPICKQLPALDGRWSELRSAFNAIAKSPDILNRSSIVSRADDLPGFVHFDADCLKIEFLSVAVTASGVEDRVVKFFVVLVI